MPFEKIQSYVYQLFYYGALLLLGLYGCIAFTGYVYLVADIRIHFTTLPVAISLWFILFTVWGSRLTDLVSWVRLVCSAIVLGWLFWGMEYVSWMYDTSFDGQWYHFDAVLNLVNGWNPFYHYLLPEQTSLSDLYLNHFPKLSWITSSCIYAFTGKMETIKVFSYYFLPVMVFLPAYTLFRLMTLSLWWTLPFAFILAFNPIVMLSLYSCMNDGVIYALFLSACCMALLYLADGKPFHLWATVILLSLLANFKYTTTIYAGLSGLVFFVWIWVSKKQKLKQLVWPAMVCALLTICWWGYPSFITNMTHMGNPVYPMMEKNQLAGFFVKEKIYPADFLDMNVAERLWASIISLPSWRNNPLSSEPRTLFKVPAYLEGYYAGTSDLAAMGPFFAESVIYCTILFVLSLVFISKRKTFYLLFMVLLLWVTVLINPECWILRYVPQLWMIPVVLLIGIFTIESLRPLAFVGLLFMFYNTYIATDIYVTGAVHKNRAIKKELQLVKDADSVAIYPGWTQSFKYRMLEFGLDTGSLQYVYVPDSNTKPFTGSLSATYTLLGNQK